MIKLLCISQFLSRYRRDRRTVALLAASLTVAAWQWQPSPVYAETGEAAIGGSVLITRHANKAAEYWNQGDYRNAREEFNRAIAYDPQNVDFYEGVLNCSEKLNEWPQVAGSLEKIFAMNPGKKKFYEYDYGMALYHLNQYDKAIPHLKAALATADIVPPPFKPLQIKADDEGAGASIPTIAPVPQAGTMTGTVAVTPPGIFGRVDSELPGVDSTSGEVKVGHDLLNYINAIRSEAIVIAEYRGYDKAPNIRYNSPPQAHYRITEVLKGPPLNKDLPIRYAFHTPLSEDAPPGWKFDDKMMPEKGSKWILFIEFAVPERGQFNTYEGSYGRQEASEKNLDKLDKLLESHNMKFLQSTH